MEINKCQVTFCYVVSASFGEPLPFIEWNKSLSKADLSKRWCGSSSHADLVFTLLLEQAGISGECGLWW